MKRLINCFCFVWLSVMAQSQTQTIKITQNAVVKDSSGEVYPYIIWQKLVQTGSYYIRPVNFKDPNTEFIIYKISEAQKKVTDSLKAIRIANALKPADSKFFKTGDKLVRFSDRDLNGKKIAIKDLLGKVIVLNFWFINCPPCRNEIPELNKLVDKYQDSSNVVFIAVCLDNAERIKEFLGTQPFKYRIIDNGSWIAQRTFGVSLYPTHVVVDKYGLIRFHTSGLTSGTIKWIDKTIDTCLKEPANSSM